MLNITKLFTNYKEPINNILGYAGGETYGPAAV